MATPASTAIRKRQQITQANRMMFVWVAGASAIIAIAAVLSITLYNKMVFNQEIIDHQSRTLETLKQNNQVVGTNDEPGDVLLNAGLLNSSAALLEIRSQSNDQPLQPVLDALPSAANSAALGASLQNVLLNIEGVSIDSLSFDTLDTGDTGAVSTGGLGPSAIPFSFTATSSDINKFFELLNRLERSIRPIKIKTLVIEVGDTSTTLTVTAESYYQSPVNIDLKEETLPKRKVRG